MLHKLDVINRNYSKVKRTTLDKLGWREKDLEKLLSERIRDLISSNDLMTIFTERPRQEEPDILALDKEGDLYFFELKRWSSNPENLLQVIRYGQKYGNSDYDYLNEMYKKKFNTNISSPELVEVHQHYFDLNDTSRLSKEDFNRKQHFLIVTNGLDQNTIEAITYWKKNGLNIDAIVYWVFEISGEFFIEFNMYSPIEGYLEYESSTYILNTNYSNNQKHTDDMISQQKAAAYYPGWMEKIEKLQKGDTVFLYKSGPGIIAYGTASGRLEKQDCDGNPDYEYYMKLENFKKLKKPFSAAEMKNVTKQGFVFRQTLFAIGEECKEKLIAEIKHNYL